MVVFCGWFLAVEFPLLFWFSGVCSRRLRVLVFAGIRPTFAVEDGGALLPLCARRVRMVAPSSRRGAVGASVLTASHDSRPRSVALHFAEAAVRHDAR